MAIRGPFMAIHVKRKNTNVHSNTTEEGGPKIAFRQPFTLT